MASPKRQRGSSTPRDLPLFPLTVDMTADEIRDSFMPAALAMAPQTHGIYITITGYDSDPRKLWHIPEVQAFCRLLVDEGILSVMKCPYKYPLAWLDGMMVFLISGGVNLDDGVPINRSVFDEYWHAVDIANQLTSERYPE